MIVIPNLFPKLKTAKNVVRALSKKRCFRTRFDIQHVKASQIPAKSPLESFHHVFSSFSGKLIRKIFSLELDEILGVFFNRLTADDKYPLQVCQNLPLSIQTKLSEKRKTYSEYFVPFPESISNFKHFEQKDDRHSYCISEITDCEGLANTTL